MLDNSKGERYRSPTTATPPDRRSILWSMVPESGPILAERRGVQMVSDGWYRARAAAIYRTATKGKLALLVGLDTFILGVLTAVRHPTGRGLGVGARLAASPDPVL